MLSIPRDVGKWKCIKGAFAGGGNIAAAIKWALARLKSDRVCSLSLESPSCSWIIKDGNA